MPLLSHKKTNSRLSAFAANPHFRTVFSPEGIQVFTFQRVPLLAMRLLHVGYSPLGRAVHHIVFLRACCKVLWIAALRIVTVVQNHASFFQWNSQPNESGHSMSPVSFVGNADHSIAVGVFCAVPIPTAREPVNSHIVTDVFHEAIIA
jgi:hypothetical protein